ncbi:MAG: hypothetical protein ABFS34_11650 [Gemmatimonadota bacterium]
MNERFGVAWLAASLAAAACGDGADSGAVAAFEARPRLVREAPGGTLWSVGGDPADTVLLMPVAIRAAAGRVFVLDRFGHRVAAFEASTGEHIWTRGRHGGGPGELDGPTDFAVTADGGVAIGDARNARVARLDRGGAAVSPIPVRDVAYVESLCSLPDAEWLLTTQTEGSRVLRLSERGEVVGRHSIPGPYPEDAPPLATQALLLGGAGGPCVLAYKMAAGFARYGGGSGFGPFRPYVEPMAPPGVDVDRSGRRRSTRLAEYKVAALDGAVVGEEVWILFHGEGQDARRLIDRYALPDGAYLGSWRLPFGADRFALDAERMYLLSRRAGYPIVAAIPRPDASAD